MEETRKKIIGMWLIFAAPLILALLLAGLKIIAWHGLPLFIVLLPVLAGYGLPLSVMLALWLVGIREQSLRKRTCCGNCVHCQETVHDREGKCLAEGIKINPRVHACSRFFGCVTKGFIPKEKIHGKDK